jgi:hypothetical protein
MKKNDLDSPQRDLYRIRLFGDQRIAHNLQGVQNRRLTDSGSVTRKKTSFFSQPATFIQPSKTYRANRFKFRTTVWPGNATDRYRYRRA